MWFDVLSVHACLVRSVLRVLLHIHDCIQCMQQITTMTTESAESESSTQPIVSLISSEGKDNIQSSIARRTTQKLVTLTASSKQKVSKTTKRKKKRTRGMGGPSRALRRAAGLHERQPRLLTITSWFVAGSQAFSRYERTQKHNYKDTTMG